MGFLIKETEKKLKKKNVIGICLDTQHAFAAGYDLRDAKKLKAVLKEFDKHIGLKRLMVMHVNDSKVELGKNVDRHETIGKGDLGLTAFKALMNEPLLKNVNMIVETPEDHKADIVTLRKLIKKK